MQLKIGLAQLNTQDDKEENLAEAQRLVRQLAARGAELVMLPEHADFIGPDEQKRRMAETLHGSPAIEAWRTLARELGIYIHNGSFLERDGEDIYNTAVVFDPEGQIVARYRKIHLFDVEIPGGKRYLESETISPGREIVTFAICQWVFGLATCYDLRFPELFRQLVRRGAHVLLLPAAFTLQTGRDHWEVLLRARAIENLCWVAAAGQWGPCPPDHLLYGRSMVVNPWGLVVARAVDGVGTLVAELDRESLQQTRTQFPALQHVRSDVCGPAPAGS